MIAEAPFLLSIAGLSASLAGLAGLVAALRRGSGLAPIDRFRLREIVEFCFANIILAIATVPMVSITGDIELTFRICGAVAFVYVVINMAVLVRRVQRLRIPTPRGALIILAALYVATVAAAGVTALTGAIGAYETLLVVLLLRPMIAFLFVLSSFDAEA